MVDARTSWRVRWMALQQQLMNGREASAMTQDDVAARLGVSRRTFQRWELGEAVPDAVEMFRWADLLGIEISSKGAISGAPVTA